ncbi:MAG: GTPase domain-containing protein [Planctomycetes bacterium]|nr:GTPase domain-containing protein [Planctomycetota bacterium]
MPSIDVKRKRIGAKIVYYGPGLSGKTANLNYLHDHLKTEYRGRLVSLSVKGGEGQQIDLLPVKFGSIRGFDVTYNLCTVPGQAFFNQTRKLVLKGTDGVVFVADSRQTRMAANVDSLQNLQENLEAHDIRLEHVPHVMQYNQRDRDNTLPVAELRAKLNMHGVLEFEASTETGEGVMETLKAVVQIVREDIEDRL